MTKIFRATKEDFDGTGNYFETSQAYTDTPTLYMTARPDTLIQGILKRVHWRLNPSNAVTYQLYLFSDAVADNYGSEMAKIFDSTDVVALGADDTEYDAEVTTPFKLASPGKIYYLITWSGAPGDTLGYIEASGERE